MESADFSGLTEAVSKECSVKTKFMGVVNTLGQTAGFMMVTGSTTKWRAKDYLLGPTEEAMKVDM